MAELTRKYSISSVPENTKIIMQHQFADILAPGHFFRGLVCSDGLANAEALGWHSSVGGDPAGGSIHKRAQ